MKWEEADKMAVEMTEVELEKLQVRLYGKPMKPGFAVPVDGRLLSLEDSGADKEAIKEKSVRLVYVYAFSVKGACTRLEGPVLIPLPNTGKPPDPDDTCAPKDTLVWIMNLPWKTFLFTQTYGTLDELLVTGIDGGIEGPTVTFEGGKLCVSFKVWVKVKIFGQTWKWDHTFRECINVASGCITVFEQSVGVGSVAVDICVEPPRVCVVFRARALGYSKSWRACTGLPAMAPADLVCTES